MSLVLPHFFTKFLMNVWLFQIKILSMLKYFNLTYPMTNLGGAEEDRTPDPLRARQVLSQLSYDPIFTSAFRLLFVMHSLAQSHTDVCSFARYACLD